MHKRLALVARGVMDIKLGGSFYNTLRNFRETPVHIPKVTSVSIAAAESTKI